MRENEFYLKNLIERIGGLFEIKHGDRKFVIERPPYREHEYLKTIDKIEKTHYYVDGKKVFLREPTTAESILAMTYDSDSVSELTLADWSCVRFGSIVRTPEGVFANPPRDANGKHITNENSLKALLNGAKKAEGIYLCEKDFGFAPYETFVLGRQEADCFVLGGLARVLEHEEKIANNLRKIISLNFHIKDSVEVYSFERVKEPVLGSFGMGSDFDLGIYWTVAYSKDWGGGFSWGVLNSS